MREAATNVVLPPNSSTQIQPHQGIALLSGDVPGLQIEMDGRTVYVAIGQTVPMQGVSRCNLINPFSVEARVCYVQSGQHVGTPLGDISAQISRVTFFSALQLSGTGSGTENVFIFYVIKPVIMSLELFSDAPGAHVVYLQNGWHSVAPPVPNDTQLISFSGTSRAVELYKSDGVNMVDFGAYWDIENLLPVTGFKMEFAAEPGTFFAVLPTNNAAQIGKLTARELGWPTRMS